MKDLKMMVAFVGTVCVLAWFGPNARSQEKPAATTPRAATRLTPLIAAAMPAVVVPALAQNGLGAELQQKVAAVKQSVRRTSRNCTSINGPKRLSSR
jgi:hypothetical protein